MTKEPGVAAPGHDQEFLDLIAQPRPFTDLTFTT
jgi:hypothetical protein